jgi:hypothetical protein
VYLRDYGKRGGRRTPLFTRLGTAGRIQLLGDAALSFSLAHLPPYIAMVSKHVCLDTNALSSPFEIDFHRLVVRKLAGRDARARARA